MIGMEPLVGTEMSFSPCKNKYDQARQQQCLESLSAMHEKSFVGDGMLVVDKNMHFFDDADFCRVLDEMAKAPIYRGMAWRMHVLIWCVEQALKQKGCFIECGVFRGFKSHFLLEYFGQRLAQRPYYLFDTFAGIDEAQADGSPIEKSEHDKVGLYEFVKHRFAGFGNVHIHRGSVPGSFEQAELPEQVAFVHLDMNSYQAEIGALEFLWRRIPNGGVLVLDDFGLHSHRSQMQHELPWLAANGHQVLEFPTGQGIVIKSDA